MKDPDVWIMIRYDIQIKSRLETYRDKLSEGRTEHIDLRRQS